MTTYVEPPTCTLALTPCPDWCTLPVGHPWDSYDSDTGLWWRGHAGPHFGSTITVDAQEKSDGSLTYGYVFTEDNDDMPLEELRKVPVEILAAIAWLEAHR